MKSRFSPTTVSWYPKWPHLLILHPLPMRELKIYAKGLMTSTFCVSKNAGASPKRNLTPLFFMLKKQVSFSTLRVQSLVYSALTWEMEGLSFSAGKAPSKSAFRFEIVDSEFMPFTYGMFLDCLTMRGVLMAEIKLGPSTDFRTIRIFNTHTNSSTAFPFPSIMLKTIQCRQDQIK